MRLLLVVAMSCLSTTTRATQQSSADPLIERVRDHLAAGRYVEAEAEASALVANVRETHGERSVEFRQATDLLVAAIVGTSRGGSQSTRALAEEAVRAGEKILGTDHVGLADSLRNLGNALVRSGEYRPAIAAYRRSVTLRERRGGPDTEELAEDLDRLAVALTANGSFDEASKIVARVLEIRESSDSNQAGLARAVEKQGVLFQRRGDYPRAHAALERAVAIWERIGPEHPDRANSLSLFAELLRLEGDLRRSHTVHLSAVTLAQKLLGPDHPDLANYLRRQAATLADQDDRAQALTVRERAVLIAEKMLGPDSLVVALHVNDLAGAYHQAGDYSRARPLYERALKSFAREPGPTDRMATVVFNLALLNARLGDFLEARRLYRTGDYDVAAGAGSAAPVRRAGAIRPRGDAEPAGARRESQALLRAGTGHPAPRAWRTASGCRQDDVESGRRAVAARADARRTGDVGAGP